MVESYCLSINGIAAQMQYYGTEFVRYMQIKSILDIIIGLILILFTILLFYIGKNLYDKDKNNDYKYDYDAFIILSFVGSFVLGIIGITETIIGINNYIVWRFAPIGAGIAEIIKGLGGK